MAIIFIGLGSNEGNRMQILRDALLDLRKNLGIHLKSSSVYETPPWGFESDHSFLNAVVKFETTHLPEEVLNILHYLESKAGRNRIPGKNYVDRTLDLDLLYYDDLIIESEKLILPHPRISSRKFVLVPMNEMDPEWMDAREKKMIRELLPATSDLSEIKLFEESFGL